MAGTNACLCLEINVIVSECPVEDKVQQGVGDSQDRETLTQLLHPFPPESLPAFLLVIFILLLFVFDSFAR
jgi:hypothetical protein